MKIFSNFYLLSFLFYFLVGGSTVLAQKGYEPGYIINENNDTVYGRIKDRKTNTFNTTLYVKIRFKRQNKRRTKKFNANSIKGYTVGDRKYTSVNMESESSFFKVSYWVGDNPQNRSFLRIIHDGYLSYYYLEYIDEDNNSIEFVDYFRKQNHKELVRVTQGIFGLKRKKLIKFFSDCPDLQLKLRNKEFKKPFEVIEYYNQWVSENPKNEAILNPLNRILINSR